MKVESGKLDRKLDLYRSKATKAPGGQVITEWCHVSTMNAQRFDMRTVDSDRAGMRDVYKMARYLIRYRRDISTADRVMIDGVNFDILAIDEPAGRRVALILTVEESTLDPIEGEE